MTFTPDGIKRLVPEVDSLFGDLNFYFKHQHTKGFDNHVDFLNALLTTRLQLEMSMEGLEELARLGNAPKLGNSDGNILAQKTLESIKELNHG